MLFDLHVHTALSSCSRLTIPEILDNSATRGLDGVCITDHDTMGALELVAEGPQPGGLVVLVGLEYTTPEGDFLLFGPFESLAPGLGARELLPLVRQRGGAAVAAHPCRLVRPMDPALLRQGLVTIMEAENGRNSALENSQAQRLAHDFSPARTGGSDAHRLAELGRIGTRFQAPIASRADLVRELLAGRCRPEVIHPGLYTPLPARAAS